MSKRKLPMPSAGRRGMTPPTRNLASDGTIPMVPVGARSLVDSGVYQHGHRVVSPQTLAETFRSLHEDEARIAWIGLYRPAEQDLATLAHEFDLHELAVEDAVHAHQRPKLERYGRTLFIVLRAARYDDAR